MTTSARPKAPDFSAPASTGSTISQCALADYRGRYLVLYFFPASFTYGCTRETIRFRDAANELAALGAGVVGVSPDTLDTQCKFTGHYEVAFPIVSDPELTIARSYQVLFPIVSRVKRMTFVIDPEGCIAARFHHELLFEKHVDDAIAFMRSVLQGA